MCSFASVYSYIHVHALPCLLRYKDAFPNAAKIFFDEKTNHSYTAPQRNRGGGGRDSINRKENAAALGRKAAAKRAKKFIQLRITSRVDFWQCA